MEKIKKSQEILTVIIAMSLMAIFIYLIIIAKEEFYYVLLLILFSTLLTGFGINIILISLIYNLITSKKYDKIINKCRYIIIFIALQLIIGLLTFFDSFLPIGDNIFDFLFYNIPTLYILFISILTITLMSISYKKSNND